MTGLEDAGTELEPRPRAGRFANSIPEGTRQRRTRGRHPRATLLKDLRFYSNAISIRVTNHLEQSLALAVEVFLWIGAAVQGEGHEIGNHVEVVAARKLATHEEDRVSRGD